MITTCRVGTAQASIKPVRLDGDGKKSNDYWLGDTEPFSFRTNTDLIYPVLN